MKVLIFEDAQVLDLYPVTVGRPAFAIHCGSFRLIDQLRILGGTARAVVRPHLEAVLAEDFPELAWPLGGDSIQLAERTLLVNARLVPSVATRRHLQGLWDAGENGVVHRGGAIAAAILPPGYSLASPDAGLKEWVAALAESPLERLEADLPLFDYPHDILRHHLSTFRDNLETRLREGAYREVANGVFAAEGSRLGEYITFDASAGPVVVEAGASIGPYCFLRGPVHVGPGARVIEHAALKDGAALGHTTKIGGEIEASVIEPYTNKQHYGFLGHSYVGSWVNMGAGTCNSDLKNTYGEVNMQYRDKKVPTRMQFVGAIIGDYAKTAINTGIFTGKTVGVCSMVYGFVTTNVPSFANYARLFGQVTALPVEVMVATQARMFARRNVTQRSCDVQLLFDMYELTRHEREQASVTPEPLSL